MLLAVMFLLAILMISLTVALPKIAKEIQRDRELETMQRGKQYIRGIKMYYKKFGRYPPNVDSLVKTSEIRYLRKKYKDPTTGKDEWRPIMLGQNKAPTAMGFFGQPLAVGGMAMAGVGQNGANGIPGATTLGGTPPPTATDPNSAATAPADPNNPASPASGNPGDPNNPAAGSAAGSTNPTGPTFGGAGIIGFSPMSPKLSILVYKKKNHYNEWEFVYDPLADMMVMGTNPGAAGPPLQPGAPGMSPGGPGTPTGNGTPPVQQPPMPTTPVNDPIQPPQ